MSTQARRLSTYSVSDHDNYVVGSHAVRKSLRATIACFCLNWPYQLRGPVVSVSCLIATVRISEPSRLPDPSGPHDIDNDGLSFAEPLDATPLKRRDVNDIRAIWDTPLTPVLRAIVTRPRVRWSKDTKATQDTRSARFPELWISEPLLYSPASGSGYAYPP